VPVRYFYNLLIHLAAPLVILHHWWRGLRDPAYRGGLGQRLGHGPSVGGGSVWVHAVSVGEVQAAEPLVRQLLRRYPTTPVVVTTVTPTGAARARALFGEKVHVRYVPLDLPGAVRRFFDRIGPRVAIILETEIWPTLYNALGQRRIPLVMASARVSERSVSRYRRMAGLFSDTLAHGLLIGAQSAADADRFRALGASPERTHVTGNIKFDFELRADVPQLGREWRRVNAARRPVWVAGSTHEGEEEILLEAHARLRREQPDALLVLVPRHPNRFDPVAALLARRGRPWTRRSSGRDVPPDADVLLGDTMGEMALYYAAADVALIGGSLRDFGAQNLIEACAVGTPVVLGPSTFNFAQAAADATAAGAALQVGDADEALAAMDALCRDPQRLRAMGETALEFASAHRGATARVANLARELLPA